jgi:hypothetical protein
MSEYRPQSQGGEPTLAANRLGRGGCALFGIALLTLCACEALAGDLPGELARPLPEDFRPAALALPEPKPIDPFAHPYVSMTGDSLSSAYPLPQIAEPPSYSPKDFRPRGRSVYETDARNPAEGNLAFNTTIWQRLDEYRNRDRIRVLTLWESGASAVSLQTDRRGGPSLQWTSRLMNRGGATHGLLDRLFPVFTGSGSRSIIGRAASAVPAKMPNVLTVPRNSPNAIP